jgi:hypothetical protein
MISCSWYLVYGRLTDKVALDLFEPIGISYHHSGRVRVNIIALSEFDQEWEAGYYGKQRGRFEAERSRWKTMFSFIPQILGVDSRKGSSSRHHVGK